MPKVFYTLPDGSERVVQARAGDSVMQTAVRNGVTGIVGQCGGELSCASCHVFVSSDELAGIPAPSEDEDDMLEGTAVERADNSRLFCQIVLVDGQHREFLAARKAIAAGTRLDPATAGLPGKLKDLLNRPSFDDGR